MEVDLPAVSVIIPTKDSAEHLPALLRSLERQTCSNFEVILVDNNSRDETVPIARRWGCTIEKSGPERSAQRNRGAELANADRLLFVDSDMELDSHIVSSTIGTIPEADAVCYLEIPLPAPTYLSQARALERRCYFQSIIFEASRGFSRRAFVDLGGYNVHLTGLEDMDIQARAIARGLRIGWISCPLYHHEENLTTMNYLRKRWGYSSSSDALFRQLHPDFWAELKSPLRRGKRVLQKLRQSESWSEVTLIPGLILVRGIEMAIRYSGSKRR